jgi:hypothetical protein
MLSRYVRMSLVCLNNTLISITQLKRVTDSSLVAILLPAAASLPPRLTIYEALRDGNAHDPANEHYGVSIRLVDYLVVVSLLIVTDPFEWMTLKPHTPEDDRKSSPLDPPVTAPAFASANQMRKILYGEPLYPRSSKPSDDTNALPSHLSAQQWAKVIHGAPLFPSLRKRSYTVSTAPSSRSPSPEVPDHPARGVTRSRWELPRESRPLTNAAAASTSILSPEIPSHTLLDPSYYDPALATTATPPPIVDPHAQLASAHASGAVSTRDRDLLVPPSQPTTSQLSGDSRPMTGSPATRPPKYSIPLPPRGRPPAAPRSSSSLGFHPTISAAPQNQTAPPSAYRNVARPFRKKLVKASSYSALPQSDHTHRSGHEGPQHPPQVIEGRDEIARRIGHIVIFVPRPLLSQRPPAAAVPPPANDIERPPPAYDSIDWRAPGWTRPQRYR